ncbi:hypothetical protein DOY81_008440 [Sarcophaga bullata]|nr:hypothetical protein DOY81_008440 [Sarcophaga bullata]
MRRESQVDKEVDHNDSDNGNGNGNDNGYVEFITFMNEIDEIFDLHNPCPSKTKMKNYIQDNQIKTKTNQEKSVICYGK